MPTVGGAAASKHAWLHVHCLKLICRASSLPRTQPVAIIMPVLMRVPRILRVGTDFSGMDAPLTALHKLITHAGGSPRVRHVFSCDFHHPCQQYIRLIHPDCEVVYDDITKRDPKATPPTDVYIWGPPCQSFSTASLCRGAEDLRGQLPKFSLRYIKAHRPRLTLMDCFQIVFLV